MPQWADSMRPWSPDKKFSFFKEYKDKTYLFLII